jgi:hypothetical protein
MKVNFSKQIDTEELSASKIDLLLVASGFEARSVFLSSNLALERIPNKVAFGFKDRRIFSRDSNDIFFKKNDFAFFDNIDGDNGETIACWLKEFLEYSAQRTNEITIVIDYSSMTRTWYASLLKALFLFSNRALKIRCIWSYSPSIYTPPPRLSVNTHVGVMPGFCNLEGLDKPIALVVGLGYDRVRGTGLVEYIEPQRTVLFYTDPAFDDQFVRDVKNNNSALFRMVDDCDMVPHPFSDLDYTIGKIIDSVGDLSQSYRVIVAPLGVKPFALLAMIALLQLKNADLWRVTGATRSVPLDRNAIGNLLLYRCDFSEEENT